MLNKLTATAFVGLSALTSLILPLAPEPAQAEGVRTRSCVGTHGSVSCVATRRDGVANPHIVQAPKAISEQESAEHQQRDKLWQTRCRPVIKQDEFGVPRYVYAARGCEFGRLD